LNEWIEAPQADAIRAAVAAAERRSSGEIVPVLLSAADDYEVAYWKAATLGALLAELAIVVRVTWGAGSGSWEGWPRGAGVALIAGVVAALVAALAVLFVPPLRPRLAGREKVERRIAQRAREAFLAYEVFKTRGRTGVLVCVFQLEHRVVVLADEGIHRVAPPGTWEALAAATAAEMRSAGPAAALLRAVERCGTLLAERGLVRAAEDLNELGDEVRGEFR
jgi:putative membrane protein